MSLNYPPEFLNFCKFVYELSRKAKTEKDFRGLLFSVCMAVAYQDLANKGFLSGVFELSDKWEPSRKILNAILEASAPLDQETIAKWIQGAREAYESQG